jgi:hypothetical protein
VQLDKSTGERLTRRISMGEAHEDFPDRLVGCEMWGNQKERLIHHSTEKR